MEIIFKGGYSRCCSSLFANPDFLFFVHRAVAEDEAWKKVGYVYDAHIKKSRADLEKRLSLLQQRKEKINPSEKAKGKQRATQLDDFMPREHELPESFQH